MKKLGWLAAGAAAGIALMLACEMRPDISPGGSVHADENDPAQRVAAITADSDPDQHVQGTLRDGKVVEGPVYVTDILPITRGASHCLFRVVKTGDDCAPDFPDSSYAILGTLDTANDLNLVPLTNSRLFVPEGSFLCAGVKPGGIGSCPLFAWSGFRPYTRAAEPTP
jgi:hypothetical protein